MPDGRRLYDLVLLESAGGGLTMPSVGVVVKLEKEALQVQKTSSKTPCPGRDLVLLWTEPLFFKIPFAEHELQAVQAGRLNTDNSILKLTS